MPGYRVHVAVDKFAIIKSPSDAEAYEVAQEMKLKIESQLEGKQGWVNKNLAMIEEQLPLNEGKDYYSTLLDVRDNLKGVEVEIQNHRAKLQDEPAIID